VDACPSCRTKNTETAKFCQECGAPLSPRGEARRRLVAALFCDLVGSTEIAERLDPEHLRKLLDRYYTAMRGAIEHHGGTVEKFIGDAVVGAFGVPIAHEDDALRAVRAALDMQAAAALLDDAVAGDGIRIQTRIGIDAGEAFADEASAREGTIAGDVFNTAARLQGTARPGEVVVSGATADMLGRRVWLEPTGPLDLKGKARPVDAFRVRSLLTTSPRYETPLIGRDRALARLTDAFEDALEARAPVLVTILAPPGVGKTRLGEALAEAVRERATILVGQTPPYGDGVTFAPLVELLAHASAAPTGDPDQIAAGLRTLLEGEADGDAVGDRLAQILGVGEAKAADASWAVRRLLEVLATDRPLVVVVEDVHWAEPPLLDLLDAVTERVHGSVLFLILARPELLELRTAWAAGKPRAVTSTLLPLAPDDARRLARLLLGDAPEPVVDRVCATAEGNPLYVEQLTAMLEDRGFLVDGTWRGTVDQELDVPTSLQALMNARIDELDRDARTVLELASIEGRRFRMSALAHLSGERTHDRAAEALVRLEPKGFVQVEDEATGRWRFTHALIRDAAYRGIAKEVRAELHERLASWVLGRDAEGAEADEAAARHLERALHLREELGERGPAIDELAIRAGELFADAGERAYADIDFITSRDLLGRAESLLPDDSPRRLDFLPSLGVALTETGHPSETEVLLSRGAQIAAASGAERDAMRARVQLLSNVVFRSPTSAEVNAALDEARRIADAFQASGDDVGLAEAAIALDYLEFMLGHAEASFGWDLVAFSHALTAGRPRELMQAAADIVFMAGFSPTPFSELGSVGTRFVDEHDPASATTGHTLLSMASLAVGDEAGFQGHENARQELLERHGLLWLGAAQDGAVGVIEALSGQPERAEQRLRSAREVFWALGDVWWVRTFDGWACIAAYEGGDRPAFLRRASDLMAPPIVPDPGAMSEQAVILSRVARLRDVPADAEAEARRSLEVLRDTDLVIHRGLALVALTEALDARGFGAEAADARDGAIGIFRAKGLTAAAERLTGWTLA